MGSPKHILAPMVEGSEYAWRVLSRRYGAQLCYSPMLHARLFSESDKQRLSFWSSMKTAKENKLVVQFCANDPDVLLKAAQEVVPYADGVDINFGCPQGIARKGKYGAFLQDDWELVRSLIQILHEKLDIPVTAKIRVFPDKARTLEYARMILAAGANILSVHCRTRDQKGQLTGLGDWSILRYLRDNLPPETVLFANGNILYHEDIQKCLDVTGFDGVMVAETNLHNPGIFMPDCFPRVDQIMEEYLDILDELKDDTSSHPIKAHMFKLIKPALMKHIDLRNELGRMRSDQMHEMRKLHHRLKSRVEEEISSLTLEQQSQTFTQGVDDQYKTIPWYRCQPYFRPTPRLEPSKLKGQQSDNDPPTTKTSSNLVENAETSLKRGIDVVEDAAFQESAQRLLAN